MITHKEHIIKYFESGIKNIKDCSREITIQSFDAIGILNIVILKKGALIFFCLNFKMCLFFTQNTQILGSK